MAQCRYRGFRNGPGEENQYENSDVWMHVFTARLVFIVVFEVTKKYPLHGYILGVLTHITAWGGDDSGLSFSILAWLHQA